MKKTIGIMFMCIIVLSGIALAVDDLKSLQVRVRGDFIEAMGTVWEDNVKLLDVPVTITCNNVTIGYTNKHELSFYTYEPNKGCKIGDIATVTADGYSEDVVVTKKRIHIGHREKVVKVSTPTPVVEVPKCYTEVCEATSTCLEWNYESECTCDWVEVWYEKWNYYGPRELCKRNDHFHCYKIFERVTTCEDVQTTCNTFEQNCSQVEISCVA